VDDGSGRLIMEDEKLIKRWLQLVTKFGYNVSGNN
jgi:hypothetical protein